MRKLIVCLVSLASAGCAYPTSSIEQGAARGHLRFPDVPTSAQVIVDGRSYGAPKNPDAMIVDVEAGKHVVDVVSGAQTLVHAEYEVDAGSTVEVKSVQ